MNPELLWVFIPTIAAISLTPGMCMTLAFTLGLSQGYRLTLWMMWGELAGVATVVSTCVLLLAWIQHYQRCISPCWRWWVAAICCGLLIACGLNPPFSSDENQPHLSAGALLILGYVTAVVNPKGWGFIIALLPGFMSVDYSAPQQQVALLGVMLPSELISMTFYATSGSRIRRLLTTDAHLAKLNKLAAGLMVTVAALMLVKI